MAVDFRFSKLSIRGFRGIQELDIDLPERMAVNLIGGNNSGKSTVLDTMDLVFKGGGTYTFTPDKYDYFHSAIKQ